MKFDTKILDFHDYDPEQTPGDIKRDLTGKTLRYYSADGSAIDLAEGVDRFGSGYHLDDGLYASAYLSEGSEVYAVLLDKKTEAVQKIDITDKIEWLDNARISETLGLEFKKLSDNKVILNLDASANDLSQRHFTSMVFSVNSDGLDAARQLSFEGAKSNNDFSLPAHYFGKSNGELNYVDSEFNIHRPFHDENGTPIPLETYKGPIHLEQNYLAFLGATQVYDEPENFQYIYRIFDVDIGSFVSDIEIAGKTEKPPYGKIEVINSGEGEILIEVAKTLSGDPFFGSADIGEGKTVISITSESYDDITTFNSNVFEKSEDIAASRANNFHLHADNEKLLYVDQYFKEVAVLNNLGEFDNVFNKSSFFLDSGMVLLTVFTQKANTDPQTEGYELKAAVYNPKSGSLETDMETVATLTSASEPSIIASSVSSGELQMAVEVDGGSKFAEIQITLPVIEMKSASVTGDMNSTILGSGDDVFFGSSEGDYVKSGGGSDDIKTGAGNDRIYVQSPSVNDDEYQETYVTLMVTVGENSSGKNVYFIDGVEKPELRLEHGKVYHFDQSHPSNVGHPIAFSGTSDGFHSGSYNDMLGGMPYGNLGMSGSYTELMVTPADPAIFYFCQAHNQMGNGTNIISSASVQDEPQIVEVDTGVGDDTVIVENDFVGKVRIANGAEGNSDSGTLMVMINKEIGKSGLINDNDLRIFINGSDDEIVIEGYYTTDDQGYTTIAGTTVLMKGWGDPGGDNHQGSEVWNGGYTDSVFDWSAGTDGQDQFYSSALLTGEVDGEVVYALSGRDGDDVIHSGGGTNLLFGGKGDDIFYVSSDAQLTSIVADVETTPGGMYINPSLNEIGLPNYGSAAGTTNTNYADKVYIEWSYEESTIEQISHGYRITNSDLDAVVEVFDVEVLKFATGDTSNPWDIKYLTAGAPVGSDSWMNGHAGKDIAYGDGSDIRFVLGNGTAPDGAALSDNGTSDILQVYANVTTVTQESYTYYQKGKVIRTTYARGYAKKTGTRDVEITEEALIWEGDRTSVDAFNFSDGVSINVINVADTTWSGEPIYSTIGTEGVDIIFGNDSDNLIDGKGGDDIIFGGDGDDVIIGGEGDDILVGGAGDDTIRGDMVDEMDAAREYFANLDSFDTNTLSIETSTVVEGNDVILGGDGVDDIESGEGKNIVASGRADMDGDGEADLDTIKEHMTTNKDIFEDDDWI